MNDVKDAANEAVANALAHAYYGGSSTVKIVLRPGMLVVTNSGTLVIDRELALAGGTSEPRNPALMRIFSHIGKIDHAGSGLNAIWRTCGRVFGRLPTLEERFLPMPEVELAVPMARAHEHGPTQRQPLGVSLGDESGKRNDAYVRTVASEIGPASEMTSEIEMASEMTSEIGLASELSPSRESLVLDLLKRNGRAVVSDIAAELGLSAPRTRAILKGMVDEGLVEAIGMNKGRYYVIPSNEGE